MRPTPARTILRRIAEPLCALLLLIGAAPVDAALLCSQSVPAVAVLDPGDSNAALPEIIVACSGGGATAPAIATNVQIFFSAALLTDALPTLSDGSTTYSGAFTSSNSAIFVGVPIVPLATALTLGNFFVDATLMTSGLSLTEFLSFSSATPVPLSNPILQVALVGEPTSAVPEPGTLMLFAAGGLALLGLHGRRRRGAHTAHAT